MEKEKSVEIHIFSRESVSKVREIVFHNIGNVNAENFNVEFDVECNGGFRWAATRPALPANLLKGTEVSFKYSIVPATKGRVHFDISWLNPRTGKTQVEKKMISLP